MWINADNHKMECWVCYICQDSDLKNLQGVLTKCVFESQHKQLFEKEVEKEEENYLGKQLVAD